MTKIEMFNQILTHLTDADEIDFVQNEIEKIETAYANRKVSDAKLAAQAERARIADAIMEVLHGTENSLCAGEIATDLDEDVSVQKVTACLSELLAAGKVERIKEKRFVSYRALA